MRGFDSGRGPAGVFEQETRDVTVRYAGLHRGLAIAKASVKAHAGRASASAVSEAPGLGATFVVRLPFAGAA
jgi:signal transduction histidine kinase